MGKKEALQKKIDKLDRKLKFYYSIIFAILSGIVWSVYAIMENKVDYKIVILCRAYSKFCSSNYN